MFFLSVHFNVNVSEKKNVFFNSCNPGKSNNISFTMRLYRFPPLEGDICQILFILFCIVALASIYAG